MTGGKQIRTVLTRVRAQHYAEVKRLKDDHFKTESEADIKQQELPGSASKLKDTAKAAEQQYDKKLQAHKSKLDAVRSQKGEFLT